MTDWGLNLRRLRLRSFRQVFIIDDAFGPRSPAYVLLGFASLYPTYVRDDGGLMERFTRPAGAGRAVTDGVSGSCPFRRRCRRRFRR